MSHQITVIERPLTAAEQDFYNVMQGHYSERAAACPDVPFLQERARSMAETATAGKMRIELAPDPNDPNVIL